MSWKNYFKHHEYREPREQLVRAIVVHISNKRNALDLGSGNFIESRYMADIFNTVTAIDNAKDVVSYAKKLNKNIRFIHKSFKKVVLKKAFFDIINAQYALPFYGKSGFKTFFKSIEKSLQKDGIIVGQFFGKKDSWNTKESQLVFHTKAEIKKMLKNFKILELIEEKQYKRTAEGQMKFWHVYHVIAKKK